MNWSWEIASRCHIASKRPAIWSTNACGVTPRAAGGLRHLLAVLVHADQEPDVVAAQPAIPRDAVGADLLVGVAEVRVAVGVVDGGGEVEPGHSGLARPAGSGPPARRRSAAAGAGAAAASRRAALRSDAAVPAARRRRLRRVRGRQWRRGRSVRRCAAVGRRRVGARARRPRRSAARRRRLAAGRGAAGRPPPSPRLQLERAATMRGLSSLRAGRPARGRCRPRRPSPGPARSRASCPSLGKRLRGVDVELVLVPEAAEQPAAAAGDLGRVEREVLVLGERRG